MPPPPNRFEYQGVSLWNFRALGTKRRFYELPKRKTVAYKGSGIRMIPDFSIATRQGKRPSKFSRKVFLLPFEIQPNYQRTFDWGHSYDGRIGHFQICKFSKVNFHVLFLKKLERICSHQNESKKSRKGRYMVCGKVCFYPLACVIGSWPLQSASQTHMPYGCVQTQRFTSKRSGGEGQRQPRALIWLRDLGSNHSTHSITHFSWISISRSLSFPPS